MPLRQIITILFLSTLACSAMATLACPHIFSAISAVIKDLDSRLIALKTEYQLIERTDEGKKKFDYYMAASERIKYEAMQPMMAKFFDELKLINSADLKQKVEKINELHPVIGPLPSSTSEHKISSRDYDSISNKYAEGNVELKNDIKYLYETIIGLTHVEGIERDELKFTQPSPEIYASFLKSEVYLEGFLKVNYTPVGYYGKDFSKKLEQTYQVIAILIIEKMKEYSSEFAELNPETLKALSRGSDVSIWDTEKEQRKKWDETMLRSLIEGYLTFKQMVTVVSMEKIVGVQTGDDLIRLIASSPGFTSELASRMPGSWLGPMAQGRQGIDDPVFLSSGRLKITDQFKAWLKIKASNDRAKRNSSPFQGFRLRTGLGCPLGFTNGQGANSPLEQVAQLFARVYNSID